MYSTVYVCIYIYYVYIYDYTYREIAAKPHRMTVDERFTCCNIHRFNMENGGKPSESHRKIGDLLRKW